MPKVSTFPILFNECKTLSIYDLKKLNYLRPGYFTSGVINWVESNTGEKRGSISIQVTARLPNPFILLSYTYNNDKPIDYRVGLVSIPSNLGKGLVWYFVCPVTGKRCRKLYLVGAKFLHRKAFTGCYYEKQTFSHIARSQIKLFDKYAGVDKAYEKIYSKHFRRQYKGRITKRYARLLKQISIGEAFSQDDIARMFTK